MSTTLISTNTITAGVTHTFTANNQQLVVAPDVIFASTGNSVISGATFDNLGVVIMGTAISNNYVSFGGNNSLFHVAAGGSFVSTVTSYNTWGVGAANPRFTGNRYIIDGTLTVLQNFGIVTNGDAHISVSGIIQGGSGGIFFFGAFGGANDTLVNSGQITGGLRNVSALGGGPRYGNGVLVEGSYNSRITNLAGGVITSVAIQNDGPAGIKYQANISGARLRNYGEINSVNGYGLDFGGASNVKYTSLINHDTIQGGLGSLRGAATADIFHNRGLMDGEMDFAAGNDTFDNRAGTVNGDVLLGTGDDFYDGRLDATVFGAILGGDGADVIYGGNNADLIEGGIGDDELRGNGGDDEIRGDNGNDLMLGNDGDDELIGGNGNDKLFGGRGNDVLNGGNNDDRINGGAGDDRIIAGGGRDILFGDAGADTFVFSSINDSGMTGATRDRIFDFDQAEGDVVHLASIDANTTIAGNQVFSYIADAAFSNTAGELRYTNAGMVEGDVDGDGAADFQILLTTAPTLTVDAFIL